MRKPVDRRDQIWAPYNYLESIPGKGLRSEHIDAFSAVLNPPSQVVEDVKRLIQELHTVSLLLDDIEDDAELRRGRPVAHSIFGVPRTINSASYAMISALQRGTQCFPQSPSIIYEEIMELHRGQSLDLFWRDTHVCPTEDQYRDMVRGKTCGLYRLAVRLLQDTASSKLRLEVVADSLGLIYQMQDDLLNLTSDQYSHNKGFAEDITEGKYSFPIIHALTQSQFPDAVVELKNILMQRTNSVVLKKHAIRLLGEVGSLEYTVDSIRREHQHAEELIRRSNLADPKPLLDLLAKLVSPSLGATSRA